MNNGQQITVAACGSTYQVSARADIYSMCLAYHIPFGKGFLDEIWLYNDFSLLHKRVGSYSDSFQNVTGCSLVMGPVFVYVDYAHGHNHAWIGKDWNNAFAQSSDNATNVRININMGYYF